VTKAAGLAWLCERQGIEASEVIAFGDMPNDIPLLTWAGHSVAMGNAHPAVRAVADEIGRTNDEDGVAVYLRTVFGL
jgi:hydroxymethylpyrimidine pyrophosphatase-like HAD family hydrolase